MKFEETAICRYPAKRVVDAMIYHLEDLVPYMDNVSEIRTDQFEEKGSEIHSVRYWQGTSKTVPVILRPFVTKQSLGWFDHTVWKPEEGRVDWRSESKHSAYSRTEGFNAFQPHADRPDDWTLCTFSGAIEIYGDKLPAVPAYLGRKVAPKLESMMVSFLIPNFKQLMKGIESYLAACDAKDSREKSAASY